MDYRFSMIMVVSKPIKGLVLIIFYIFVPLISVEILCQLRFKDELQNSWFQQGTNSQKELYPLGNTQPPNMNAQSISPFVSSSHQKQTRTLIRFQTDQYGAILPSGVNQALSSDQPFILFCGGSTSENWAVPEGQRMPDAYGHAIGKSVINIAKSGKDIHDCTKSIDKFFSLFPNNPPSQIVVANNVNTLMAFSKNKIESQSSAETSERPNPSFKTFLRKWLVEQNFLPGTYLAAHKVKYLFSENLPIEDSLLAKCCHGPADVNRHGKNFDWASQSTMESYKRYTDKASRNLAAELKKNNFPLNRTLIFIEPNSYALDRTIGKFDFRQKLVGFEPNEELTLKESSKITNQYDCIYKHSFTKEGFQTASIRPELLKGTHFYDAVHPTAVGAQFIGKQLAQEAILSGTLK